MPVRKSNWFDTGQKALVALFAIGGFIASGSVAYYKIFANESEIIKNREHFNRELELQERRSDSRFSRATEWNMERRKVDEELEKRVRQLEIEMSALKAK